MQVEHTAPPGPNFCISMAVTTDVSSQPGTTSESGTRTKETQEMDRPAEAARPAAAGLLIDVHMPLAESDNSCMSTVERSPSPSSNGSPEDKDDPYFTLGAWKKNVWTAEEDTKLLSLMLNAQGKVRWSVVGSQMDGRSGKQCRERWHNHLSPEVSKSKWSAEEDRAIVEAVHLYGTRWSEIVKMFPGRTDNAIKNRWNSMQRKEDRRQKRIAEEQSGATVAAPDAKQRRRRRLVQAADLQPAAALQHVPGGFLPSAGSALMQQLEGVGVEPPQVKPGGRRKRAVQARVDMDAASLLLGAVSKIQSEADALSALPPVAKSRVASDTDPGYSTMALPMYLSAPMAGHADSHATVASAVAAASTAAVAAAKAASAAAARTMKTAGSTFVPTPRTAPSADAATKTASLSAVSVAYAGVPAYPALTVGRHPVLRLEPLKDGEASFKSECQRTPSTPCLHSFSAHDRFIGCSSPRHAMPWKRDESASSYSPFVRGAADKSSPTEERIGELAAESDGGPMRRAETGADAADAAGAERVGVGLDSADTEIEAVRAIQSLNRKASPTLGPPHASERLGAPLPCAHAADESKGEPARLAALIA